MGRSGISTRNGIDPLSLAQMTSAESLFHTFRYLVQRDEVALLVEFCNLVQVGMLALEFTPHAQLTILQRDNKRRLSESMLDNIRF